MVTGAALGLVVVCICTTATHLPSVGARSGGDTGHDIDWVQWVLVDISPSTSDDAGRQVEWDLPADTVEWYVRLCQSHVKSTLHHQPKNTQ